MRGRCDGELQTGEVCGGLVGTAREDLRKEAWRGVCLERERATARGGHGAGSRCEEGGARKSSRERNENNNGDQGSATGWGDGQGLTVELKEGQEGTPPHPAEDKIELGCEPNALPRR